MPSLRVCHYERLGLEDRWADEDKIKKAYRKAVLRCHPDKNVGNEEEAAEEFRAVQDAYDCLSDPNERKWYDDHREAILRGQDVENDDGMESEYVVSLFHLFSGTCYSGYGDDEDGFYEIYREAFEDLGECEVDGFEAENGKNAKGCPPTPPSFGTSKSSWDEVGAFYNYWECFFTVLGFAWCDKYDSRDAKDRRVRRAIDAENAKARKAGKREYSDQVVQLIYFIKKRDPRVKKHKEDMEREKKVKEKLKREEEARQKKARVEAMERWKVEAAEEEARRILEEKDRVRVRLDELDSDEEAGRFTSGGKGGRRKKKGRKKVSRGEKWSDDKGDDIPSAPAPLATEFSQLSPERKWTRKKVKTR
eukprot:CAMPEP_0118654254 /NCGR_PEP_ID=MMETSP0785-20121206/12291_1 /TAXON_ID=91992 /ORGANISM="Bolidomonas pacifica, Strain CCMP 1866" /LENGTH=362 /DNA_ID=CAMNT_0006546901 /DNA_START=151 /DNA_END=1236 /DNA_ORIENTATION=+